MAEIEYNDFLKHKVKAVDYDSRWLEVKKIDNKVKIIDRYSCTYSYTYRFTLVENIKESVEEAIKTALGLKFAFANSDPITTEFKVNGFTNHKYVTVTPKLANIEYYFYSDYYTEYLNTNKIPTEDVSLGKATLTWDKKNKAFLLPNGEKIPINIKLPDTTYQTDITFKQLYNSTLTKWVNDIYAMLYSE